MSQRQRQQMLSLLGLRGATLGIQRKSSPGLGLHPRGGAVACARGSEGIQWSCFGKCWKTASEIHLLL